MKKLSLPVIGAGTAAVLALGFGGAVASGAIGGSVQPTSDGSVYVAPTETAAATTAEAPAAPVEVPAPAPAPVAPPVAEASAATVEAVTTPAPQAPAATATPSEIGAYSPTGPFTDSAGLTYIPAPQEPAPKLPGEEGYVPPTGG